MKRCRRWVGKLRQPITKHDKLALCSTSSLRSNNIPTILSEIWYFGMFRFVTSSSNPNIKSPLRRYLTGSPSKRAPNHQYRAVQWTKLEAETKEMLKKIELSLRQDGIHSTKTSSRIKDAVTSQDTFRLVGQWSQLASISPKNKNAAIRCQEVLEILEYKCKDTTLEPNRHYYDLLLQALCHTGQVQVAHEILLKHSKDGIETKEMSGRLAKVSAKSFHIVMNGWIADQPKPRRNSSRQYQQEVLQQVQELYQSLESLYHSTGERDQELRPNERTLTALLVSWAQSERKDAPNKIVQLLRQASEQGQKVDLVLFHALLQSLTKATAPKSRSANREAFRQSAEFCEHLLHMAISQFGLTLTAQSYSLVINAWAHCEAMEQKGQAAERAEKLLRLMMHSYSTDGANVKPNTLTFTTCMAAWSRCNRPERAHALLEELMELYDQTGDLDLKPDTVSGNAVVLAWSRSNTSSAVTKTKEALENLQTFATADLISYNALLHAYARSGMYREALTLVEELEENGISTQNSRLLPDVVSYNCVLHALVRIKREEAKAALELGIGLEAQKLVEKMKALANKKNRAQVAPTAATYTLLLQAYAKKGNSTFEYDNTLSEAASLGGIHMILEDLGLSLSSTNRKRKHNATTRLDAMFFSALLQACSSFHQVRYHHNEASTLAFEVMVRVLEAFSGGHGQLRPITSRLPTLSIPQFPAFRIHDDWLFVVMVETCDRVIGASVNNLGPPLELVDDATTANPDATDLGHSSRPVIISGPKLEDWTALIVAIVNRVEKEGYLSRRVVARLQGLSKTLARSKHDSHCKPRQIEEWLFPDAKNDNSVSGSQSNEHDDGNSRREWPREWSRRIPSNHRP
ncbi:unnamed protein product [Cylindrotheca closterium]|uniref:Pentacotripeptide-repeat region of PRORP domain-containing protein n=1 Tax=Cylindrotheca closterium TaxID=2856 RepID=A0AAD2G9R4_9STRA|nr:unnamed protein product [Cylindrotheca closterium]